MTIQTTKKSRKKVVFLSILALVLATCVVLGTMAWLTAQDSITNTFTVGNFEKPDTGNPETPDPDPDSGEEPEDPNISVDGYIIEPTWDKADEHKLLPGATFYKDPYVGIGQGSENAAVYVFIDNPFPNQSVYFKLNDAWEAVDGQTTAGPQEGTYTGGLFHYTADDGDGILRASADKDSWTSRPVFTKVFVNDKATTEDLNNVQTKEITVSCFIHQVTDGDGTQIPEETIETAAIAALVPKTEP